MATPIPEVGMAEKRKARQPRTMWVELKDAIGGTVSPLEIYRDGEFVTSFHATSGDLVKLPVAVANRKIAKGRALKAEAPKG